MEEFLLDKMLSTQYLMQEKWFPGVQVLSQGEQILINTRALIHEVIEVENEVSWKHWKKPVQIDQDKVKDEVADIFIFLMNLINISGMDASELYDRTLNKIDVNIQRQQIGY